MMKLILTPIEREYLVELLEIYGTPNALILRDKLTDGLEDSPSFRSREGDEHCSETFPCHHCDLCDPYRY